MPRLLKNNINIYNAVDYKVPIISHKNDFRTSVDRAHSLWIGPPEQKIPVPSIPNYCNLYNIKECKNDVRSNYQEQHDWKQMTDKTRAELTMKCTRPQMIKSFQERITQKPPTAINEYQTIHQLEYSRKFPEVEANINRDLLCSRVQRPTNVIFSNTESAAKYLDPYVTTNMSDFVPYSATAQGGIGKRDNITFWDWVGVPKAKGYGLKEPPQKIKLREEPIYDKVMFVNVAHNRLMPNKLKFVPHTGLTSESKSNYIQPSPMLFNLDEGKVRPVNLPPTDLNTGTTEYTVYGSGKKIHSYLDARAK